MFTAVVPYQACGPDCKHHAYRLQCEHRTVLLDKHITRIAVGWHKPSVTRPSTRKIIAVRLSNMVLVCPTAMVKGVPLLQLSSSHSYIRRRPSADHVHLTRGRFCVTCTHMAASARPQGSTRLPFRQREDRSTMTTCD